jgi:hypothetical protein
VPRALRLHFDVHSMSMSMSASSGGSISFAPISDPESVVLEVMSGKGGASWTCRLEISIQDVCLATIG